MEREKKAIIFASVARCILKNKEKCKGNRYRIDIKSKTDDMILWRIIDKKERKNYIVKQNIFNGKSRWHLLEGKQAKRQT